MAGAEMFAGGFNGQIFGIVRNKTMFRKATAFW
jgi:hypothetical protein